jgi:hypothetical protein
MIFVHIGLGKTATTSLQKYVFPELASVTGFTYNHHDARKTLGKAALFPLSSKEKEELRLIFKNGNHIVSLESLVGWNPVTWSEFAERNLEVFGEDAVILITMREPLEWMTSVYQEMVHEGNITTPQEFFINSAEWELAERISSRYRLDYFNVDSADFRALYDDYKFRFKDVIVMDIKNIDNLKFLDFFQGINTGERQRIKNILAKQRKLHRGYSSSAMSLTLAFEYFLNVFRLSTAGTQSRRLIKYEGFFSCEELGFSKKTEKESLELGLTGKIGKWMKARIIPRWSSFIKGGYDRVIPYKKYRLPNDVYINESLLVENRKFLDEQG